MIASLLSNDNLLDNRIDIKFDDNIVSISRITIVQTTYTDNGIDLMVVGDESPSENGTIKRRSLEISKYFTSEICQDICSYVYKCDYDNVTIRSKNILGITVTKQSNNKSYFNRLS